MKKMQDLVPVLIGVEDDQNIYFWFYQKNSEKLCRNVCTSMEDAMRKLARAKKAGFKAYVSCSVSLDAAKSLQKIKKLDENDPCRMVVKVQYDNYPKTYTFRCRQYHLPNEKVCVYTGNPKEYKNVTVVECLTIKESEIRKLAKSLNREDLDELYCEHAIET